MAFGRSSRFAASGRCAATLAAARPADRPLPQAALAAAPPIPSSPCGLLLGCCWAPACMRAWRIERRAKFRSRISNRVTMHEIIMKLWANRLKFETQARMKFDQVSNAHNSSNATEEEMDNWQNGGRSCAPIWCPPWPDSNFPGQPRHGRMPENCAQVEGVAAWSKQRSSISNEHPSPVFSKWTVPRLETFFLYIGLSSNFRALLIPENLVLLLLLY